MIHPLTITFGDNLSGDAINRGFTSSIMGIHVNTPAGSWRKRLQQLQVNLRIMDAHKGKRDQSSTVQVFSNERLDIIAVLESIKQRRQTFGLIIQRKHRLVHQREGTAARLGQYSGLGDPILEDRQL
jgi:hypothetical protein